MSNDSYLDNFDFSPIGKAIKDARCERGLSREYVAETLKISLSHLLSIENKGKPPGFRVFYALMTMFELSADEFFFPDSTGQNTHPNSTRLQINKLLDSLSDEELLFFKTVLITNRTLEATRNNQNSQNE
jgi:Predicted transcriptional regulators